MIKPELWRDLIGAPFESGARGPDSFDCYGLIAEIYRRRGIEVTPHDTPRDADVETVTLAAIGAEWVEIERPTPGCLLLFRDRGLVRHVGISLDEDLFIHASFRRAQVSVERLSAVRSFLPLVGSYEPREAPNALR